jgi:glycosyltransferase involved in cell wall biosynthesis
MVKKDPLISIVTPVFNQREYIKETIDSVLSQNYKNLEYIVVDGGSTDGTLKILRKQKNIKLIVGPDKGQSDAINKGMRIARGDILCYLNSDDIFLPGALKQVSDIYKSVPNFYWLTGECILIDPRGSRVRSFVSMYKKVFSMVSQNKIFDRSLFLYIFNYISQPSTFFSRKMFEQVGEFDINLHMVMDYDLWLRFMKISLPMYIPEVLSAFRLHPDSKTSLRYAQMIKETALVAKRYTNSKLVITLNKIHGKIVEFLYKFI